MTNEKKICKQIEELEPLSESIKNLTTPEEKLSYLKKFTLVKKWMSGEHLANSIFEKLLPEHQIVFLSLIAIGEGNQIIRQFEQSGKDWHLLQDLMIQLERIEKFYDLIGGIVGYHLEFIKQLKNPDKCEPVEEYFHPPGFDFSKEPGVDKALIYLAIENLPKIAAIFPVGGAGDRLALHDNSSDEPLPAAKLLFDSRTLFESLFRDLQAKENLYYKLFGKQITIPVVMMTSREKNNHHHITNIFHNEMWFNRDISKIHTIIQPLAPVITEEGHWSFSDNLKLNVKPGGHGVIWKLALDEGIFDLLLSQGIQKAFVRQINNPVASTDKGMFGLIGAGFSDHKVFGIASCERPVDIAEGMIVLKKTKKGSSHCYCITNIEYTEFLKHGIEDKPKEPGSPYSIFPANTNILFADLKAVRDVVKQRPFPGMIANIKKTFSTLDENGKLHRVKAGRLETTMQNIADEFVWKFPEPLDEKKIQQLPTFVTFNKRKKTISTTKKSYIEGECPNQTPEKGYYDLLTNHWDLLHNYCGFQVPKLGSLDEFLKMGPSFIFHYHPALGQLYSIIAQKIRRGTFAKGAELHLEIAEVDLENITLDGSLIIYATATLGHLNKSGLLNYSNQTSKVELKDVTVLNQGIDRKETKEYWSGLYHRKECLDLHIEGNAEFYAEGVTFNGPKRIVVPQNTRMVARQEGTKVVFDTTPIDEPTWFWKYSVNKTWDVLLEKKSRRLPPIAT